MKKIFYLFLILSLALGFQSCGGSGGSGDDPEPEPEPGVTKAKVSFVLKSDINGFQDNELKTALTHLRLYLYDKDQKLISVSKYTSADALKAIELDKGNYTVVLIGNVPEDGNISSEATGTPLSSMSVQLTKADGATHYTPLGDVMFAKSTLTVDDKDLTVDLSVKRTLSATKVQLTDYSGQISDAGVLVPGVGTTLGFGDNKWTNPNTVFVTMKAGAITKAAETGKQYSISLNIAIVNATGETEQKIQCNIIAKDETGQVLAAQLLEVPATTKPNTEVSLNLSVESDPTETGKINVSVSEVEVKNEEGKKEDVTPDDITKQETDIDLDLTPEDWMTGNEEEVEIGTKEDFITPGGQENDWQQGEEEHVTLDSTHLQLR